MKNIVKGGLNVYGFDVGIIMLDSSFPRIVGDIGNAKTWNYPVLYKKVEGKVPNKVVLDLTKDDIEPFVQAAKELEAEGVKAITTSCGFLSLFQQELSEAVSIPVFTSSLLFVPMLARMIDLKRKVGILTANKKTLSSMHLNKVGIDESTVKIVGLEDKKVFTNYTVYNWDQVDINECRKELQEAANELMNDDTVSVVVLECTNMSPFIKDISDIVKVPVFDIVTMVNMYYNGLNPIGFGE